MERIALSDGYDITRVIRGGWQLAGGHGAVDRDEAIADMQAYVDAGITTFDCADIYTGVEELIGEFIGRTSADVRVHTKFVPDLDQLAALNRSAVQATIDRSLARLRVDRLDLVQFHWWDFSQPAFVDVGGYLTDLQRVGKIRCLGVTNFDAVHLQLLLDAGIPVVSNQVQYSVLDERPARALRSLAEHNDLSLLTYGTVAGGFLSERWVGVPEPRELENRSLVKYKLIIDDCGGWEVFQSVLTGLVAIAMQLGVDIATLCSAYVLHQHRVAAVIVGARNVTHLDATTRIPELVLDSATLREVADVLDQLQPLEGDVYELERDRDGRHGRIMRYNLSREPASA